MGQDDRSNIDKAIDVLLYAPLGVAAYVREVGPSFLRMFVGKGRSEIEQRQRRANEKLDQYKKVGQFAVTFGTPEVKRQVGEHLDTVRGLAEQTLAGFVPPSNGPGESSRPSARVVVESAETSEESAAPPEPELAIRDYDELSAPQVVERLEGLEPEELDAVRAYETAHRGRRTVLGKIDQLSV